MLFLSEAMEAFLFATTASRSQLSPSPGPSPSHEPPQEPNQNQISRQRKLDLNGSPWGWDFIRRLRCNYIFAKEDWGNGMRPKWNTFSGHSLRVPTLQKLIAQVTEDPLQCKPFFLNHLI